MEPRMSPTPHSRQANNNNNEMHTRTKLDASPHQTLNSKQAQLLPFHLQVLQSLYNNKTNNDKNNNQESLSVHQKEDDTVPDKVWKSIEAFLQNRQGLMKYKSTALQCRSIHRQALLFVKTQQRRARVGSALVKLENSPRKTLSHRPYYGSPQKRSIKQPGSAFTVVAHVMGRRSAHVEACLEQRVVQPFRPLLEWTKSKLRALDNQQKQYTTRLQERRHAISQEFLSLHAYASTRSHEQVVQRIREKDVHSPEEQNWWVATQSKIRLWSLLEKELEALLV